MNRDLASTFGSQSRWPRRSWRLHGPLMWKGCGLLRHGVRIWCSARAVHGHGNEGSGYHRNARTALDLAELTIGSADPRRRRRHF